MRTVAAILVMLVAVTVATPAAALEIAKNADQTYTVTLADEEKALLTRYVAEGGKLAEFRNGIQNWLDNLKARFRKMDGAAMRDRYERLAPEQRQQVDAILGDKP